MLWITGENHPRRIFSTGGRNIAGAPVLTPDRQTSDAPDHQVATYAFERFTMQWEHRRFAGNNTDKGENVGCYFYGTKGIFHLGWRSGWTFYPADSKSPPVTEAAQLNAPDGQNIRELWTDFLRAIRTGAAPACDVADVNRASNLALLGMVSMRLGRSLEWDGAAERIVGDEVANGFLRREYRTGWEYPAV